MFNLGIGYCAVVPAADVAAGRPRDRQRRGRRGRRRVGGRVIGVLVCGDGIEPPGAARRRASRRRGRVEPAAASGRSTRADAAGDPDGRVRARATTRAATRATWRWPTGSRAAASSSSCCAGYMHLLTTAVPRALLRARVVNIHPALLPAFPGAHAVEDALAAGVAETGATVHSWTRASTPGPVSAPGARARAAGGHARDAARAHPARRAPPPARGREGADRRMTVRRALLSAYDKTGLAAFARGLAGLGVELRRERWHGELLADDGIPVTPVEELTGFAEMLGHRVVTLHPAVHGGILARRDVPEDMAELERARHRPDRPRLRQPLPVRAHRRPARRRVGGRDRADRRRRAGDAPCGGEEPRPRRPRLPPGGLRAGARGAPRDAARSSRRARGARSRRAPSRRTAAYDAAVAGWLGARRGVPRDARAGLRPRASTSRTARTRTSGAPTTPSVARGRTSSPGSSSCRASRSRTTTSTTSPPRGCSTPSSTARPCVIVKHANPCGVAVGETIEEAYAKALAADPVSPTAASSSSTDPSARRSARRSRSSSSRCSSRPATTRPRSRRSRRSETSACSSTTSVAPSSRASATCSRVLGGLLVQERDVGPRPARRDGRRLRRRRPRRLGGAPVRVDGGQARHLERDRDRPRTGRRSGSAPGR